MSKRNIIFNSAVLVALVVADAGRHRQGKPSVHTCMNDDLSRRLDISIDLH